MKLLNENFFRFLLGFAGILFLSLLIILSVGFYEVEVKGGLAVPGKSGAGVGAAVVRPDFPESRTVPPVPWREPEYPPRLE